MSLGSAPPFAPSSSVTVVDACACAPAREVDDGPGSVTETVSSASGMTSTVRRRAGRSLKSALSNDPNSESAVAADPLATLVSNDSSSGILCIEGDEEEGPGSVLSGTLGVGVVVTSTGRVLLRCL